MNLIGLLLNMILNRGEWCRIIPKHNLGKAILLEGQYDETYMPNSADMSEPSHVSEELDGPRVLLALLPFKELFSSTQLLTKIEWQGAGVCSPW